MKAGNIMEAWGGIAGLQNCMDVMFDEAVQNAECLCQCSAN